MTDIRQRLLNAFADEHREHLEAVRGMLTMLDDGNGGAASLDLTELHRRLHSLKGAARATDLKPIETLSHHLESLVSKAQEGSISVDQETAKVIHAGLDAIEDWFAAFISGGDPPGIDHVIAAAEATVPGNAATPGTASRGPSQGAVKAAEGAGFANPAPNIQESLRIDVESLERMLRCAGEILVIGDEFRDVGAWNRQIADSLDRLAALADHLQFESLAGTKRFVADTGLAFRAGQELKNELQLLHREVRQADTRQRDCAWRFRQKSRVLRDEVQQVRMVSAESVFGALRKMVRDLAADEAKSVDLSLAGGDTRADRMVLQRLKDPLVHVLRNAVAHGVESPKEREKAGKPAAGRVRVGISAQGARLVLRVEDDGRGLDLAAINRIARNRNFLGKDEPDIESYPEAQDILFSAGFSTIDAVSELSGRGVGMSVVHRAVTGLQGDLTLSQGPDGGLAVTISVPLSIASTKVLVFKVSDETFALPTSGIERLHRAALSQLEFVNGQAVFVPEGSDEPIAVAGLRSLFGMPSADARDDDMGTFVVLRSGSGSVAIAIDTAVSVRDAIVEDVSLVLPEKDLISGTVVLEGGSVVPVLNPTSLVMRFGELGDAPQLQTMPPQDEERLPTILVVDDSITTRTLEKSILEANGYRVWLSVDGVDAMEQLRSRPVDLVVSDIEMPRLDGFGLLRELKRDEALRRIPVVLVTSRDNEEDRKRGLALGADAYVVKQRFDQLDLLETIGQLL